MKKFIILLSLAFIPFSLLLCSCGGEDEEPETPEQTAARAQDALYEELQSVIVGHWVGAQHYYRGMFREHGWEDISNISWNQEHIFNADGTAVDIVSPSQQYEGCWRLEKNPEFISSDWQINSIPGVYLIFTYSNIGLSPSKKVIWLDELNHEFLRFAPTLMGIGRQPSLSEVSGESAIRYKKHGSFI